MRDREIAVKRRAGGDDKFLFFSFFVLITTDKGEDVDNIKGGGEGEESTQRRVDDGR